jgi:heme A synthase
MVIYHLPAMALFAFLVSVVFATLSKESLREKVLYGIKCFALFMIIAIALGWMTYFFPRH